MLDSLAFGLRRKVPILLQTEAAECGLACLAMVATFHGHRMDLASLRRRHPVSLKGLTLSSLVRIADELKLATRPLRLELDHMSRLRLPCILHWDMNHFVVLCEVRGSSIIIHDPAFGRRRLSFAEASSHFTGVALELWPNEGFEEKQEQSRITVRQLLGRVSGIGGALSSVFLLAFALEVFSLVSPFYLQWVVDEAVVSADSDLLTTLAIGFALLLVLQVLIGTARSWLIMFLGTTLNVQWRANVFSHLIRLPVDYFQKRHLGDIASRFSSIDHIQETLTTSFVAAVLDGVMSIATLVMMYIYSPRLALVVCIAMSLYAIIRVISYRALKTATDAQIVFAAKQSSHFLESVRGAKAIKLFQREDLRRTTWLGLMVDQLNAGLKVQKLGIGYGSINALLIGIENLLVIWLAARMVLAGDFSVGMLMAFKAYKDQFDGRVSGLVDKLLQFQMLKVHGARLADIVRTTPEPLPGAASPGEESGRRGDILVKDLRFRYGEHEPLVLDGVDLHVQEGESVAIVGSSGCGKSTLMHVMLGVLEPTSGTVIIGGVETRDKGAVALRSMIGAVTQDDSLLAGSIADNICFFAPDADRAHVERCARAAAIHEEIISMPMGYETLVGDMGSVLSGGQKQRVLLARALYRKPKILLLDEATSHLDLAKERAVNEAIRELKITRVIIAHRTETIGSASRVIHLAGGRVVETPEKQPPGGQDVPSGALAAGTALQESGIEDGADPEPLSSLPMAPPVLRCA